MNKTWLLSIACVAVFSPLAAWAEGEAPTPDMVGQPSDNDEVVVVATRSPQMLSRIGSSVSVVSIDEIEQTQTVVVTDLLTRLPGVSFSRSGGTGGRTSLNIRGAETEQTIVVIDGVKLNDPGSAGGGYNFANLLTGDIQRIEVLRGAQSTLWGSQAIGGVVNIVTAEPSRPFEVAANAEGGSFNTGSGKIAAGGAGDRATWRLAGNYYTTDGISAFANGTERDGYRNAGLSGRFRYDIADDISADVRGAYARGRNGFDPSTTDTREFSKTEEFLGYAGLNFGLFDNQLKNRIAYAHTFTDRDNVNLNQAVTQRTFDAAGKNKRWEYQGALALSGTWNAVFGAEHERSTFRTVSPTAANPTPIPARAGSTLTSGYGLLQADVISNLTLTGGLRFDSHSTFGSRALGQAAFAWSLNDGSTIVRASFGQGFKAPSLYQLYSMYGNTSLDPEKANSWDGGVEQRLFDGVLSVGATGFYRKTRNQIDFVSCPGVNPLCTPGRLGVYDNIGQTKATGVELTAAAAFEALTIDANYTYTHTENVTPGNINFGKQLARRPAHAANVAVNYAWSEAFSSGIAVKHVGDTYDTAANTFVLDDYTLVDLRAAWKATPHVEVYGRVENVFDDTYQTARNFGTPGRAFYAGVRARF